MAQLRLAQPFFLARYLRELEGGLQETTIQGGDEDEDTHLELREPRIRLSGTGGADSVEPTGSDRAGPRRKSAEPYVNSEPGRASVDADGHAGNAESVHPVEHNARWTQHVHQFVTDDADGFDTIAGNLEFSVLFDVVVWREWIDHRKSFFAGHEREQQCRHSWSELDAHILAAHIHDVVARRHVYAVDSSNVVDDERRGLRRVADLRHVTGIDDAQ